jgi:hypothetical protein
MNYSQRDWFELTVIAFMLVIGTGVIAFLARLFFIINK